jgi:hypothetical protein
MQNAIIKTGNRMKVVKSGEGKLPKISMIGLIAKATRGVCIA